MKIISWNINGLRAAWGHGLPGFIEQEQADIYAFQETKIPFPMKAAEIVGYHAYWSFSQKKRGYSGTLVLTKSEPLSVSYNMGDAAFDCEGRLILLEYAHFYFLNCYVPNSQGSSERYDYRCEWDRRFRKFIAGLTAHKPIIICGDFNATVSDDDIYPENKWIEINSEGYMSAERETLLALLDGGLTDSFRHIHPDEKNTYSWWTNRRNKRSENRGWRLDYAFVSDSLADKIMESSLLTEVMGSDHCPVCLEMNMDFPVLPQTAKRGSRKKMEHYLSLDGNTFLREMASQDLSYVWDHIDWEAAEENLANMQMALAKSAYTKDIDLITKWQKRIIFSLDAKLLAVRHVCSSASSSGMDHVMWRTSKEKMSAVLSLVSADYQPYPSRLLLIEAKNGKQRRVHLETWHDRAMQTLYAFALDPVSESWADRKSFAFRKGRSFFDLNEYIKQTFSNPDMPDWAFIGDVHQCYETISHKWIMDNIPMDKRILKEFLSAGYVFGGRLFPMETGIGIGLSLSPIIANMVLDGLQDFVYQKLYPDGKIDYANGNVLRYADDIIISARTQEQAEHMRDILTEFLFLRGLELSPEKSHVVDVREGFTFMSRQYIKKNDIVCVYPAEHAVSNFMESIRDTVESHTGSQQGLITKLNRKIDGWATYHKVEDSYDVFRKIDVYIKALLMESCEKKHPKWDRAKILAKYWYQTKDGDYIYALPDKKDVRIKYLADTMLVRHNKVKTNINPYIDLEYMKYREDERSIQNVTGIYRGIWNRQNGCCYYCGCPILKDQEKTVAEVHPEQSRKAGRYAYIHIRCQNCVVEEHSCDTFPDSSAELSALLERLQDGRRPAGQKFLPLHEYFRSCTKQKLTLSFDEIEEILGCKLGQCKVFPQYWYRTGFAYISQAWIENGYEMKNLHIDQKYIVFQKTDNNTLPVNIPDVFLNKRIPADAKYELENYFSYITRKYGL